MLNTIGVHKGVHFVPFSLAKWFIHTNGKGPRWMHVLFMSVYAVSFQLNVLLVLQILKADCQMVAALQGIMKRWASMNYCFFDAGNVGMLSCTFCQLIWWFFRNSYANRPNAKNGLRASCPAIVKLISHNPVKAWMPRLLWYVKYFPVGYAIIAGVQDWAYTLLTSHLSYA